ncbi:molybdate ABC transporter substrate-binding protein [Vreelandella jeotgali]|uniref:molybdate ABC transporter substrate-binding protein n=1 Tax=Vreelandella jeotgali TaxID=553386 RepID=UPI000370E3B5|nr:molybdate ABC transporter substrate-binding protein [Halomonas jeotgali]
MRRKAVYRKTICSFIFTGILFSMPAFADDLLIAAGAGYRQFVEALTKDFKDQNDVNVERTYGNMGQVAAQVKMGTGIQLVVGDHRYLSTSGVNYMDYHTVGEGKLVLAWREGLKLASPDALRDAERFARIALPDTEKAVYGRAGSEYLQRSGLDTAIDDERLLKVGTVPQATTYVASGDVDAGFINLTDAKANAERLGGYMVLDDHHEPIRIVAATTATHSEDNVVRRFITYTKSDKAHDIATAHGL